ncbi:hypothetical protein SLE2022_296490 [Rubroshorea leprosula]
MPSSSKSFGSEDDGDLRRGPWTLEEDTLLVHYIARHGEGRWNLLAKHAGLRRTGKSCRLRWLNYLKPDVKRGNLSPEEQWLILELHSKWGNRWSKIAQYLPGRTDNEIKNYWRTRVQKQARHLKIDANSTAFRDFIRLFCMPRLIQKIEGSSSSSSIMSPQNSSALPPLLDSASKPNSTPVASSLLPNTGQGPSTLSEAIQSLDLHDQNSDASEYSCTNSAISSQISQFSKCPTSPFHVIGNNVDHNILAKDFSVDNGCYDMESMNLVATSSMVENYSIGDFPVADSNWFDSGFSDSLWNMGG